MNDLEEEGCTSVSGRSPALAANRERVMIVKDEEKLATEERAWKMDE